MSKDFRDHLDLCFQQQQQSLQQAFMPQEAVLQQIVENCVVVHSDTCLNQLQQALQQGPSTLGAATQQKQQAGAEKRQQVLELLTGVVLRGVSNGDSQNNTQLERNVDIDMTPLLANLENRVVAHIDTCFEKQEEVLRGVMAAQQQQQLSFQEQQQSLQRVAAALKQQESSRGGAAAPPQQVGQLMFQPCQTSVPTSSALNAEVTAQPTMYTPLLQGDVDVASDPVFNSTAADIVHQKDSNVRMAALLPQVEALKSSIAESLKKHEYDVEQLYHKTGCWQHLARNETFKNVIMCAIILNIVWIAVETDNNKEEFLYNAAPVFQISDNLFCCIFSFEILCRFGAFKRKSSALRDGWFLFDTFLVASMVWETWVMVIMFVAFDWAGGAKTAKNSQALRVLRLFRLVRVARATRLLRAAPELLILARGMLAGLRSVLAVLIMLMLLVFVYGIMFTMTLSATVVGSGVFETVPQSMNSLLLQVLCGPDAVFITGLLDYSPVHYLLYLSFILIAVLTLMNMLIGILCTVVSQVTETAREEALYVEVQRQVDRLAEEIDTDGDGNISKEEFDTIIGNTQMIHSFTELDVDVISFANFSTFIYEQCDQISYSDFGRLVCQFRGNKPPSLHDVMDLRRYVTMEILSLERRLLADLRGDFTPGLFEQSP